MGEVLGNYSVPKYLCNAIGGGELILLKGERPPVGDVLESR
jgi:hypothetical protein